MSTIRVSKTSNYSCINNQPLRDASLSWAARGLLAYLLSMPDDWTASTAHLVKQSPAARDHVLSLLRELETAGYLLRVRKQDSKGQWEWEHVVRETAENPNENPSTDYPSTDKAVIYKVLTDKEVLKKKEGAAPRPPQIELLREITNRYPPKPIWSLLTNRLGPAPDRSKLELVYQAWIMRGYSPTNYEGITDWYKSGIPPNNGHRLPTQAEMNAGGRGKLVI